MTDVDPAALAVDEPTFNDFDDDPDDSDAVDAYATEVAAAVAAFGVPVLEPGTAA